MEVARLTITIGSARCWRELDSKLSGLSEDVRLYCSCEIPGEPGSKFTTDPVSGLEPVWNHTTEITGITAGDVLDFAVLQAGRDEKGWEKSEEEVAGRATLASRDFFPHGFEGEIPLTGGWATGTLAISISIEGAGLMSEIASTVPCPLGVAGPQVGSAYSAWDPVPEVTGCHVPSGGILSMGPSGHVMPQQPPTQEELQSLTVTVVGARLPRLADWAPMPDAYCTCQIAGEPNSVFSTEAVFNSLEPHWNYAAELTGVEHGHSLEFTISDARNRETIARGVLESPQFYPYGWEGDLPLAASAGAHGTLNVHVSAASGASAFPALHAPASTGKLLPGSGRAPEESHLQEWDWCAGSAAPRGLKPPPQATQPPPPAQQAPLQPQQPLPSPHALQPPPSPLAQQSATQPATPLALVGNPVKKGVTDTATLMAAGRLIGERRISMQEAIAAGNLLEEEAGAVLAAEPAPVPGRRRALQASGGRPPSPGRRRIEPVATIVAGEAHASARSGYGTGAAVFPGGLSGPLQSPTVVQHHAVTITTGPPPASYVSVAALQPAPGRILGPAAPAQRACSPLRVVPAPAWVAQPPQLAPACHTRGLSPARSHWEPVASAPFPACAPCLSQALGCGLSPLPQLRAVSPRPRAVSPRPRGLQPPMGLAPLPLLPTGLVLTPPQ